MNISTFIGVGENLHCTRIFKVGGKYCREKDGGAFVIRYGGETGPAELPVPGTFTERADWEAGKVKHCAVAIWQGNYGDDAGQAAGKDYLAALARSQETNGATYLDVNLDEFSTDIEERVRLMKWTVGIVQEASSLPVSVDSSNLDILRAGLEAVDPERGRPMVNSVSLERTDAVDLAREFDAVVIASAAGAAGLPTDVDGRMNNLAELMPALKESGFSLDRIHIDPLVFPVSVDVANGKQFLDACRAVRETYGPEVHCVAGLSNVSFGMPNRKLINQVFAYLAVEHGADGGIVDPAQINRKILNSLDTESDEFKLARDLVMGEDEFGMNYITAMRSGS